MHFWNNFLKQVDLRFYCFFFPEATRLNFPSPNKTLFQKTWNPIHSPIARLAGSANSQQSKNIIPLGNPLCSWALGHIEQTCILKPKYVKGLEHRIILNLNHRLRNVLRINAKPLTTKYHITVTVSGNSRFAHCRHLTTATGILFIFFISFILKSKGV